MKCFVINLEKDIVRRNNMQQLLSKHNINFEFIDAVYGKNIPKDELYKYYDENKAKREAIGRGLTISEIGCAMSHLKAYQTIISQDLPYALILEDDILIVPEFKDTLDGIESVLKQSNFLDVILLGGDNFWYTKWGATSIYHKHSIVKTHHDVWYTYSYIITQEIARKMIDKITPIFTVIDHWDYYNRKGWCNVYAVVPNIVIPSSDSLLSNIENERLSEKKYSNHSILELLHHKIIYNLFYKPIIRRLLRVIYRLKQNNKNYYYNGID